MRWWLRGMILLGGLAPVGCVLGHRATPPIALVGFAPDGEMLATVVWQSFPPESAGSELRVWDLATGRERRDERRSLPYPLLEISEDERLVVRRASGGPTSLASLTRWPERVLLDGSYDVVGCTVALRANGRVLATAGDQGEAGRDTRVRLWDVATGRLLRTLDDGKACETMAFTPDGRTLVGVGGLRLAAWEVESGRSLAWTQQAGMIFAPLAVAPDGSTLAVQGAGGKLNVLDLADGHVRASFPFLQADTLVFDPDGRRLAVADEEKPVTVFDLAPGREVVRFTGHARPPLIGRAKRETNMYLTGLSLRTGVNLFPAANDLVTLTSNAVCALVFDPAGRRVASSDADGSARVWDAATGREQFRCEHRTEPSWAALGAAGGWAALCGVLACRRRRAGRADQRA